MIFFSGFHYFVPLILIAIVGGILTSFGYVLLLIPGIYLSVAYMFGGMLVLDRKLEFWQALETSRKIITKEWFSMFGFLILLVLLNFVGVLALGVGVIVTSLITGCALTAAYHDIIGIESTDF